MNAILRVVLLVGLLGNIQAEQGKESVQIIDHPHKNEYQANFPGTDKHKYGYELKENREFHHTTTEEDGVRLGCYGYVLFGKKYSTQYVADVKGYRPVNTHDPITVFPKSGGERKASFVGDFSEDQERSENIRYFFPDGCKGTDIMISPIEMHMIPTGLKAKSGKSLNTIKSTDSDVSSQSTNVETARVPNLNVLVPPFDPSELHNHLVSSKPFTITPPTVAQTKPTQPPIEPPTQQPTKPPTQPTKPPTQPTTQPPTQPATNPQTEPPTYPSTEATPPETPPTQAFITRPITVANTYLPAESTNTRKPTPAVLTKIPAPIDTNYRFGTPAPNTCDNTCCEADDAPKLVLPIPLQGSTGECGKFAKLIIPMEGLNSDSLSHLSQGSDATEFIRSILESLS